MYIFHCHPLTKKGQFDRKKIAQQVHIKKKQK